MITSVSGWNVSTAFVSAKISCEKGSFMRRESPMPPLPEIDAVMRCPANFSQSSSKSDTVALRISDIWRSYFPNKSFKYGDKATTLTVVEPTSIPT